MPILSDLWDFIKKNTLDKTSLDERLIGGIKNVFSSPPVQPQVFQSRQPVRPPMMSVQPPQMSIQPPVLKQPTNDVEARINTLKQKLMAPVNTGMDTLKQVFKVDPSKYQIGNLDSSYGSQVLKNAINLGMDKKIIPSKTYTSGPGGNYGIRGVDLGAIFDKVTNEGLKGIVPSLRVSKKEPLDLMGTAYNKLVTENAAKVNPFLGRVAEMGPSVLPPVFAYNMAKFGLNVPGETSAIMSNPKLNAGQKAVEIGGREVLPALTYKYAPAIMKKIIPEQTYNQLSKIMGSVITTPPIRELLIKSAGRGAGMMTMINIANNVKDGIEQGYDPKTIALKIAQSTPEALLSGGIFGVIGDIPSYRTRGTRIRPQNAGLLPESRPIEPQTKPLNEIMTTQSKPINEVMKPKVVGGVSKLNIKPINPKIKQLGDYKLDSEEIFSPVVNVNPQELKGGQFFVDNKIVNQKIADIQAGKPISPIVVKDGQVIDGYHTGEALTKLGYKEFPVTFVDTKGFPSDSSKYKSPSVVEGGVNKIPYTENAPVKSDGSLADILSLRIKEGELGSTLPSQDELAKKYGISKPITNWVKVKKDNNLNLEQTALVRDVANAMNKSSKNFDVDQAVRGLVRRVKTLNPNQYDAFRMSADFTQKGSFKPFWNTWKIPGWKQLQEEANATLVKPDVFLKPKSVKISDILTEKPAVNVTTPSGGSKVAPISYTHPKTPLNEIFVKPKAKLEAKRPLKGKYAEFPDEEPSFEPTSSRTITEGSSGEPPSSNPPPKKEPTSFEKYDYQKKVYEHGINNTKEARQRLSQYLGEYKNAEVIGNEVGAKMVKHDPKQLENILSKIEKPVKGEVKEPIVQEVNNIAGEYLKKMIDAGIDVEERKNYITHLYNEVAKEFIGYQPGKTNLESKLYATKQRKIETYEQAKEYGFTPKYSQVRQIIAHYVRAAERKIAQQKYINDMVEKGLFVKGDMLEGKKQFKQVYGTEYFAVKDIANIANKIFDPQSEWKWLKGLANLSTAAQDVFLSGGGLGTPLNAYYLALLNKELLGGNIKGAGVASIKSLTEKKANKYFLIPENMKTIKEIQLGDKDTEGMAVETTLDIESLGDKPGAFLSAWKTLTKTLTGNIRGDEGALKQFQDTWAKVVNEPTFKRALPIMNIEFYKMVKKELLGKGLSETEATNIALKTYKNWTGNESMLALALQDKNWQNFLTSVLFAKVYRRTMGKFFLNNVSALKSPNKPENKRNLLFLAAFILTAALADLINKKGTGVHIWQNKGNTKDKLVIPYNDKKDVVAIPVFNSLWTIPKTIFGVAAGLMQGDTTKAFQSVQSATSMLLNPLISIANNKNWYGEEIYDKSDSAEVRYEKIGKYLATQYNHPYIQAYMDNQAGKKTGVATVSQALELPFRFYTDKQLNTAEYYSIRDEVVNKLPPDLRDTYNKIHQKDRTDITDEDGLYVYNIHDAMGDASDKLANPEIMKADEEIARKMAKRTGQEVNPFYDLEDWQQEKVLMLRTFYPGDEEKTKQTNANKEWLQPYWDKSAEYTKNLIETGAFKDTNTEKVPSKFDKPTPSKELQSKLDFYNTLPKGTGARSNFLKSNPDVLDYFNKNSAITELQREALGLTPKEDTGYGGGSGFNYKLYYALKDIMKSYTDKKDLNKSLATLMAKKPKVKSIINEVTKTKKINIYRPLDDIMKEYQTKLFGKKKL